MLAVNIPEVLAEVQDVFLRYEAALNDNDLDTLDASFWPTPLTVRYGLFENLYGHDAIAEFRRTRPKVDLRRTLANTVITTFGRDVATASTEFVKKDSGRRGRQMQTWVRTDDGWRVVAAHVSWFAAP